MGPATSIGGLRNPIAIHAPNSLVRVHAHAATDGRAFWLVDPAARQINARIVAFRDWIMAEGSAAGTG